MKQFLVGALVVIGGPTLIGLALQAINKHVVPLHGCCGPGPYINPRNPCLQLEWCDAGLLAYATAGTAVLLLVGFVVLCAYYFLRAVGSLVPGDAP